MRKVAQYNPVPSSEYNDVWGYTQGTSEYAVFGSKEKIFVMDVTDCYNPVEIFQFDGGDNTSWIYLCCL